MSAFSLKKLLSQERTLTACCEDFSTQQGVPLSTLLGLNSQSSNSVSELQPEASHYHNKQRRGKQRYCAASFYNNLSDLINVCLLNLDIDVSILIGFLFRCWWTDICHCQSSPLMSAINSCEIETSTQQHWIKKKHSMKKQVRRAVAGIHW